MTHILAITQESSVTITIDALDEANEGGRGDLFDALEQITQESANVVKVFVPIRDDGDIVDRFGQCVNLPSRCCGP